MDIIPETDQFCRICLKDRIFNDVYLSLSFSEPEQKSFKDKLKMCVPQMVSGTFLVVAFINQN